MARARTGTLTLNLRSLDEPGSKLEQASIIWLVTIGISGGNQMNELYWIPLGVAVCFVLYLILGSFFTVRTVKKLPKIRYSTKRSEEHTSELQSRLHLVC